MAASTVVLEPVGRVALVRDAQSSRYNVETGGQQVLDEAVPWGQGRGCSCG